MSSNFQTTAELLASGNAVGYVVNDASNFGTVTMLPWIPQTTFAVALRLMELDSAVSYLPDQKAKDTEPRHFLVSILVDMQLSFVHDALVEMKLRNCVTSNW